MAGDENSLYHALAKFSPDMVAADLSFPGFDGNKRRMGAQEKVSKNKSHSI